MDVSREGIAERLEKAIAIRGLGKASFQREMERKGAPNSSVPAVYRYLRGDGATPSVEFLAAAADILKAPVSWLAFGIEERKSGVESPWPAAAHDIEVVDALIAKEGGSGWQRDALLRFCHKLRDAEGVESPWLGMYKAGDPLSDHGLVELLKAALEKLKQWEQDRENARKSEFLKAAIVTRSDSRGWYVVRSDGLLQQFAEEIVALGERAGGWDAHDQSGASPSIDYSF